MKDILIKGLQERFLGLNTKDASLIVESICHISKPPEPINTGLLLEHITIDSLKMRGHSVKSSNILLSMKNILIDSRFRAKVADFGLAMKKKSGLSGTPFW